MFTCEHPPIILKDSKLDIDKSNPIEGFESLLKHYGMVPKVEVEVEVESEYKEINAYDFLKNKIPQEIEIFEMQNKKSFPDYNQFIQNFNSKVIIEKLEYEQSILYARLTQLNSNWDKSPNQQNSPTQEINLSDIIPSE